jgi:tetratricopeptide (TPR) repeat protein
MRVAPAKPSVRLAAARADAMVMGDQLLRAFVDVLDLASRERPVLVLIDDLQWGDLPSVKLLNAALRSDAERPLFVLALARPDVTDTFPALWTERHLTRIVLGGLPKRAAEQLVRSVLGGAVDASQVARIVGRAEGIPFSIEELVRAEARGQEESPDTVLAMAQRRLEGLDPEARQVLRAASIFGPRFWKGGVLALVGQAKARIADDTFEQLARDEVIAPVRTSKLWGEQEFEFRHGIVQDAAYAMLTDADRELGHRLAATWLIEKGEQDPMMLAVHAERGADRNAAGAWYAVAAAEALDGIDLKNAIARAEQAVACGVTGEARGGARRIQAEAAYWAGDFETARRHADEALALLPAGTSVWFDTASHAIAARARIGDTESMLGAFDAARRTSPSSGAVASRVQALARGASLLVFQGRGDIAQEVLGEIEHDAMSVVGEHPGALARYHQCRALLASVRGDLGGYLEGSRSAAQLFLAAGDQRNELAQRANLADALVECGSYAAAVAAARDVESGASRLGLANTVAHAQQNVGLALAMLGSFEEADRTQRAALAEFVRADEKRLAGGCRIYLAQTALAFGDVARAEMEIDEAVRLLQTTPPLRAYAFAVLAQVTLKKGDTARAKDHADAALGLLDELGGLESGTSTVFLAAAETAMASGDAVRARTIAERGAHWVSARGATLKDAALRESFFGKVRDNVRLLSLAAEQGQVQP